MPTTLEVKTPRLVTALPGPNAKRVVEQDAKFMSPSYTRDYPLVAKRGHGAIVEDVDGNSFLDFAAGIAVCSTGHCHPKVVSAIQKQAAELIHMSGTDFYYESMPQLAERLARTMPGAEDKKVFFTNSGTEAVEGEIRHQAGQDGCVLRLLPRPLNGGAFSYGVEINAAKGIRCVAQRHRAHSIPVRLPMRARPHCGDLRRGDPRTTRRADFQALVRSRGCSRHHH
jgi:Aminotransferase class-III